MKVWLRRFSLVARATSLPRRGIWVFLLPILRLLLWAVPSLQDHKIEVSEARIDLAGAEHWGGAWQQRTRGAVSGVDVHSSEFSSGSPVRLDYEFVECGGVERQCGNAMELVFRWRELGDGRDAEIA